jgi:hypothetical protein
MYRFVSKDSGLGPPLATACSRLVEWTAWGAVGPYKAVTESAVSCHTLGKLQFYH